MSTILVKSPLTNLVVVFTIVLFIAGYALQQQTVRGIQQSLRPIVPPPPQIHVDQTPLASILKSSRAFGGSVGSGGHVAYQQYVGPKAETTSVNWDRLAHVQLVSNHHSVCNAVMLFGELHRLKSPAKRVFLFPKAWALENKAGKGETVDPYLATSRRLLRMAARRYGVELLPIAPTVKGADEDAESSYSVASLYAMTDYERVLLLSTPGVILDATPLDSVLAYAPTAPLAQLQRDDVGGVNETDLTLAMPDAEAHAALLKAAKLSPSPDALSPDVFSDTLILDSSTDGTKLVASISTLHDETTDFNATAYLSSAAYIRFSDPKLPGPEYDVPWSDKLRARPRNKDADWVWTKLYGTFAQKRMEICGLDLEPWYGF